MTTAISPTTEHINAGAAARILGCTRHRVLSFTAHGLLKATSVAGHVFFAKREVESLAERLKRARRPSRTVSR